VNENILSDGQLSPPFQFPQPPGAVAGLSLGMEVGIIGGGILAETDPGGPCVVDGEAEDDAKDVVVVEAFEMIVEIVDVELDFGLI
jgi:hypothetical protein